MKKIAGILLFFCGFLGYSQNPNDCVNAIEVCGDLPIGIVPDGIGINEFDLPSNPDPPCNYSFNSQSVWFKFEIVGDGSLAFDLAPDNKTDDYDFAIYQSQKCDSLGEVVRCSTTSPWQAPFHTEDAITGLGFNSDDFTEGPGSRGDGYVRFIDAVAGETYYLLVDRAQGSGSFQLQLTGTAQLPAQPLYNTPQTVSFLDDDFCTSDQRHRFDLNEQRDLITSGFPDTRVSFHLSLNDANLGINPILDDFTNTTNPQTLFARIFTETGTCTAIEEIDFEILTTAGLNYPDQHFICSPLLPLRYDLADLRQVLENTDTRNLSINFHDSFGDAIALQDAIEELNLTDLPYSLYISTVLVDDPENCPAVNTITLSSSPNPEIGTVSDIFREEVCLVDGETLTINFEQQKTEILNGRDASTFAVTLFASEEDRTDQTNPLPLNYTTDDSRQIIYARLVDLRTGCFSDTEFRILPQRISAYNDPGNLFTCDDETQDGRAVFDLGTLSDLVTSGHDSTGVSFHLTEDDAVIDSNPLPENYLSLSEDQIIYLRIYDEVNSCFSIENIRLIINGILQPTEPVEDTIYLCEIPTTNFSLADFLDALEDQNSAYIYTFYNTESDAYAKNNPIDGIPVVSDETFFWIATENPNLPNRCPLIQQASILVEDATPGTVPTVQGCIDGNSTYPLNLELVKDPLLDGRPATEFQVDFYATPEDRDTRTNTLPDIFDIPLGRYTIYASVQNRQAGCTGFGEFEVIVREEVQFDPPFDKFVCDPQFPVQYGLDEIRAELSMKYPDLSFSFFESQADASNLENEVNALTLSALPFALYVVAENPAEPSSCSSVAVINLLTAAPPVLNLSYEIRQNEICNSNLTELNLDLAEIRTTILDGRDESQFELVFYASETDRDQNRNPLPDDYLTSNNEQSLYIQLYDVDTGCTANAIVEIVPGDLEAFNLPQDLSGCDGLVQDGQTFFDLAAQRDAIAAGFQDIDVTFHPSLADAENNSNPLPLSYQNTAVSETIYARIFNAGSVCSTIESFSVTVNPVLTKPDPTPPVLYLCEPNFPEIFSLADISNTLNDQDDTLDYTFYTSEEDAYNGQNSISELAVNSMTATFYVKTENRSSTQSCPLVEAVIVESVFAPIPGFTAPVQVCDENRQFIEVDLTQTKQAILDGRSPADFEVLFFRSQEDFNAGQPALPELLSLPATDYIFYAKLTDLRTGCNSSAPISIKSLASPNFAMNDQIYCIDSGMPYALIAPEGYAYYIWSTGEEGPDLQTIQVNEGGSYSVTVINDENCDTTRSLELQVSTAPVIDEIEVTAFEYPNNTVTVTASGDGQYVYALDDGEFQESNVFKPVPRGYHTVTVQDVNGCGMASEEILVLEYTRVVTPNNDGINDVFKIIGLDEYPGSEVVIFDRYGKIIAILNADSYGWDGLYNGRPAFMTDYWFVLTLPDGFEVKGHFSLIR
ncbi:MAG: T9SS type B sorting domain-containing protein [Leeuwenhoekiella sp.]